MEKNNHKHDSEVSQKSQDWMRKQFRGTVMSLCISERSDHGILLWGIASSIWDSIEKTGL